MRGDDDILIALSVHACAMADVVTIPAKEYEFLRECVRVLYEAIQEQFRPEFVRRVLRARKHLGEGGGVTLRTRKELRAYLASL